MKSLILALALCCGLQAQDRKIDPPVSPLSIQILYRNAEGCQNIIDLGISPICSQDIMVQMQTGDMRVHFFIVVIAYTDSFGLRQMQVQEVVSQPQGNPEFQIVTSAASFGNGIDNVTGLSATVIADDGESATVRQ